MVKAVLDASAFLRFLDSEPGADYVRQLLEQAHDRELEIKIAAVNWGEIIYTAVRGRGVAASVDLATMLQTLPISIQACGTAAATAAALFKEKFKIPYADAFAGSLAQSEAALLVTADFDFKRIPADVLKMEFLPLKRKPSH